MKILATSTAEGVGAIGPWINANIKEIISEALQEGLRGLWVVPDVVNDKLRGVGGHTMASVALTLILSVLIFLRKT
jgi:hypothetical protein